MVYSDQHGGQHCFNGGQSEAPRKSTKKQHDTGLRVELQLAPTLCSMQHRPNGLPAPECVRIALSVFQSDISHYSY